MIMNYFFFRGIKGVCELDLCPVNYLREIYDILCYPANEYANNLN